MNHLVLLVRSQWQFLCIVTKASESSLLAAESMYYGPESASLAKKRVLGSERKSHPPNSKGRKLTFNTDEPEQKALFDLRPSLASFP